MSIISPKFLHRFAGTMAGGSSGNRQTPHRYTLRKAFTMATIDPQEIAAFQRWKETQHFATPGVYWLEVEKYGNVKYDHAILLRVLPTLETIRYELKHSGWIQRLDCWMPNEGKRPAGGNGGYRCRTKNIAAYDQSNDRGGDMDRLETKFTPKMMEDERNHHPDDEMPKKATRRRKKAAAPDGMVAA